MTIVDHDINIIGGELFDPPNDKYKKFFETFQEIDKLENTQWKVAHIIGYFCRMYYKQYGKNYQFKFNSELPSKCFEVFQVKKLAMQLTSKADLLKAYIDWIFVNKIPNTKRRITSISFLTKEDIVNEYKINVLLAGNDTGSNNVDRSTLLPEKYKSIFSNTKYNIETYGDLSFIYQTCDESSHDLLECFSQLENIGFDKNILKEIV